MHSGWGLCGCQVGFRPVQFHWEDLEDVVCDALLWDVAILDMHVPGFAERICKAPLPDDAAVSSESEADFAATWQQKRQKRTRVSQPHSAYSLGSVQVSECRFDVVQVVLAKPPHQRGLLRRLHQCLCSFNSRTQLLVLRHLWLSAGIFVQQCRSSALIGFKLAVVHVSQQSLSCCFV